MFNQVVLHRPVYQGKFDCGLLAETLLFYADTLVLLDRGSLVAAVKSLGLESLLQMQDQYGVRFSYHRSQFGTITNSSGGMQVHRFASFQLGGTVNRKVRTAAQEIEETLERELGNGRRVRKQIKAFIKNVAQKDIADGDSKSITQATLLDITKPSFSQEILPEILKYYCPGGEFSALSVVYQVLPVGEEFLLNTNIDFNALDDLYRLVPGQESGGLNAPFLASTMLSARAEAYLASTYMSSYVTDPLSSSVMRKNFLDLVRRRERDADEIDLFQETHLEGFRSIRETINTGGATMEEFFDVLKRAERFKDWVKEINPDKNLISEYFKACTSGTICDSMPAKSFRFVFTNGLAAAVSSLLSPLGGAAASLGISAADAFLLDRILNGWKPNQFVDGPLKNFASGK